MSSSTWTVILVVEGPSDARRIPHLVDSWIREKVDWVEDMDSFREYRSPASGDRYLAIRSIPALAREHGLPQLHGNFGGGDASLLRKLRQILTKLGFRDRSDVVVVWGRDVDQSLARAAEAAEARRVAQDSGEPDILRAVASPSGEAWVMLGWSPETKEERLAHTLVTKKYKFDPIQEPHRPSPKGVGKTAAPSKAILDELAATEPDRERRCLEAASTVRDARSTITGLDDFRADVDAWLTRA